MTAYAGIPLTTPSGYTLGTFCAIDTKPRRWSERDVELLQVFAAAGMTAIELYDQREQARVAAEALADSEAELRQTQKLEVIGGLAGGIAHDFNNMLTAVLGYAELLLAFARRQVLRPERLNAGGVVTDVAGMLERLIGDQVALRLELRDAQAEVDVDPTQLHQALTNLVLNARDAMPDGGGVVTVSTDVVELAGERTVGELEPVSGRCVRIRVSDTGAGIPPEVEERLFEPFFTTKPAGRGTGLGLSTTLGIVRQSGGHRSVGTSSGRGACFDVFLPVAA